MSGDCACNSDRVFTHAIGALMACGLTHDQAREAIAAQYRGEEHEPSAKLKAMPGKMRMIVSHATGGMHQDINLSTNDICVQITQHVNYVYEHGKEKGRAESQPN